MMRNDTGRGFRSVSYPTISPRADKGSSGLEADAGVISFLRPPSGLMSIGLLAQSAGAEISSGRRRVFTSTRKMAWVNTAGLKRLTDLTATL